MKKGIFIAISGPSGVGKNTIADILTERGYGIYSVSATTRKMRDGEKDGKDYFFISTEEFEKKIANQEFIEYTKYNNNYYGTLKSFVQDRLDNGENVIAVIEIQGGMNIKRIFPEAVLIFIMPPSFEELEQRLRKRNTDSEEDILKRMEIARMEIDYRTKYDYTVVNNVLEDTVEEIVDIIKKEIEKRDI